MGYRLPTDPRHASAGGDEPVRHDPYRSFVGVPDIGRFAMVSGEVRALLGRRSECRGDRSIGKGRGAAWPSPFSFCPGGPTRASPLRRGRRLLNRGGQYPRRDRQGAILELIRAHRVTSQMELKALLEEEGIGVTQATLST